MFQAGILEKIKTHFMFSNSPTPRKSCRLCDNLGKCGTEKLKLYWSIIGPIVTYACEVWVLKEPIKNKL